MKSVLRLESLSDDELLARLDQVVTRMRRVEAELICHMAEVDRRQLYAREACSSMHVYATSRLHLSDAEAYRDRAAPGCAVADPASAAAAPAGEAGAGRARGRRRRTKRGHRRRGAGRRRGTLSGPRSRGPALPGE